jgi:hypothetical protein
MSPSGPSLSISPHTHSHYRVIIRLGPALSHIHYVDIDTSHFSGNEAPASSVHALALTEEELALPGDKLKIGVNDPRWEEILPVVGLGPNSRHIFELAQEGKGLEGKWGVLKVGMIPDGGMVSAIRSHAAGHRLFSQSRCKGVRGGEGINAFGIYNWAIAVYARRGGRHYAYELITKQSGSHFSRAKEDTACGGAEAGQDPSIVFHHVPLPRRSLATYKATKPTRSHDEVSR